MRRNAAGLRKRHLTSGNSPPHQTAMMRRMMRRRGAPATVAGMGETQRHIHTFNPEQFRVMSEAIEAMGRRIAEAAASMALPQTVTPAPVTEPAPLQPVVEPWTFHDPRQQCDVVAFLDLQQQVRHVPTTRASEVPKTWRPVYLGEPRG